MLATQQMTSVVAVHPHWIGSLALGSDGTVRHEQHGSGGRYVLTDSALLVQWDDYPADVFLANQDGYIHASIISLDQIGPTRSGYRLFTPTRLSIALPDTGYEVELRVGTSDIPTFRGVFVDYDNPNLPPSADTIIDLAPM